MTIAVVKQQRATIIARTSPAGALQQSNSPVTLKSAAVGSGVSRLDELLDVNPDSANTAAGSTLVYDPVTDKYTVKLLNIDGGNF
jgi:hypothetical protein